MRRWCSSTCATSLETDPSQTRSSKASPSWPYSPAKPAPRPFKLDREALAYYDDGRHGVGGGGGRIRGAGRRTAGRHPVQRQLPADRRPRFSTAASRATKGFDLNTALGKLLDDPDTLAVLRSTCRKWPAWSIRRRSAMARGFSLTMIRGFHAADVHRREAEQPSPKTWRPCKTLSEAPGTRTGLRPLRPPTNVVRPSCRLCSRPPSHKHAPV